MKDIYILAIESSCDDTSAAVLKNNVVVSNFIANQEIHREYGGVVPELASRAHQQNIIPVVHKALQTANISKNDLNAIAFTQGPGLLGSLLVGSCFARGLAMSLEIPMIEVDHLLAHIHALFIDTPDSKPEKPEFPFIFLLVSGGHTRLGIMHDYLEIEYLGNTIDDAAGEAFDKAAKILGLQYPGGPIIDRLAKQGNKYAFSFNKPKIPNYDFSFSGLKTSFLYFIRDELKKNPNFINENLNDLCASIQRTIVEILIEKVSLLVKKTKIKQVGVVGGVAANSELREKFTEFANSEGVKLFLPQIKFTTDNAAMIGMVAYYKYLKNDFADISSSPYASGSV